ncbi:MAG: hypothetical protein VX963_08840 [Actinomycetota bacterium]|jgi:hypothetical protein|nr:hypothetical protein [Acidimicrobiaceae bacterium]MEC7916366.1 hypothetical protein [Actinomycetota bacterium]|tara:strand:+ start:98 stop:814 length:717 start_codon:yes stop_codon:yes gene_type:complete
MALTSVEILEMPLDESSGAMPWYSHIVDWVELEISGLSDTQLDFHDPSPDKEWMWWSCRRQVSHIAWDALIFPKRRAGHLLWPDGNVPEPINWTEHQMGPNNKWDRFLDSDLFWEIPDLLDKLKLGVSWLTRLVEEQTTESLRSEMRTVRGTEFWKYVITTLPRGASADPEDDSSITYNLEGSLWMVFYEMLSHVRSIQRLKIHQGLTPSVNLPRVGYLRLPHYWGETNENGPGMKRL